MREEYQKKYDISGMSVLNFVKDYWVFLLLIGSIIGTFTKNEMRFSEYEGRITNIESESKENNNVFMQMQLDIQQIKTSILYIQKSIDSK